MADAKSKYDSALSFYSGSDKKKKKKKDPIAPSEYFELNGTDWKRTPQGKAFLDSLKPDNDKKFVMPTDDSVIDPYRRLRELNALYAPLPPYTGADYPEATKKAILGMENGDELLADQSYKAARSSIGEQKRQLKEVGKDDSTSAEDLGFMNYTLGYASAPGAAWMGAAKATRENNRGAKEVSDFLSKSAKKGGRLAKFIDVNADNALSGLVGAMDKWGEIQNRVLLGDSDENEKLNSEVKKNVDKAVRLQDTYGGSEELARVGWERDGSIARGFAGLATDAIQDPTNILGLGKAPATKMAAREFAENATRESVEAVTREALKESAKEGVEGLAKQALEKGVDKAVSKSIRRQVAKRGAKESAEAIAKAASAKPLTVAENAAKVTGVDADRFTNEVMRLAKSYGRDGERLLNANSSKLGKAGLDTVDQKIIDIALRRSHEGFGAAYLDVPFVGQAQLPGSRAVGTAVSRILEADPVNPLMKWRGKGDDFTGSIADIGRAIGQRNPFGKIQSQGGRLSRPFLQQEMAASAAAKRTATEMASHEANKAIKEAKGKTGSRQFERAAGIAQKYLADAQDIQADGMLGKLLGGGNGVNIDRAVAAALADPAAEGVDPALIRRIMEDQVDMAGRSAQRARENLVPSGLIENYQPSRLPADGRERVAQRVMGKLYGDAPNPDVTPLARLVNTAIDETGALVTGNRGFNPPARGDGYEAAQKALSQQNIRGLIDNPDAPFQQSKLYRNPAERGAAGVLTETNPYRAFEQVQAEQDILAAQEDLLYTLASAYGKRMTPEAGEKMLRGSGSDLVVKTMDGSYFRMPDGDTAQRVKNLVDTGNIRGRSDSKLGRGAEAVGRALNPLMTTLRPAFTGINELGNLALMGRQGYGRAIPESFMLQMRLIQAGGDIDKIPDAATRSILRQAQENGVINALDLNPSTVFDPSHNSIVDKTPVVGKYNQFMKRINALAENNSRLAVFLEEMAKNGSNPAAARQRVDDILFNYDVSALSPIEQEVRKFAPFYTFSRRNFPATAEYYAKHPTRLANLQRIRQNFGSEENENQAELLRSQPPYLRDQIMFKADDYTIPTQDKGLGESMVNVRLPDADALRAMSIGERLATGNTDEKVAAALEVPRELIGPQYTMLNSLLSGYSERGEKVASGDGGSGYDTINALLSQIPMVGPALAAADKQDKEATRGGDKAAPLRFLVNQALPFPTVDYNPASWERSNTIIGNEELKEREQNLENPNILQRLLGIEPIELPEESKERIAADSRIKELKEDVKASNKEATAQGRLVEKGQSMSRQYRRWQAGYQDRPFARSDFVQPSNEEWEYLQEIDPEAYAYWQNEWKKKKGITAEEKRYQDYWLKTFGIEK